MGRRRSRQNQTSVAALFPKYTGLDFRCGQQRSRAYRRGQRRVDAHVGRRRVEGCCTVDLREQAGPAQRYERRGDYGQARTALVTQPELVHPSYLRYIRRRPLRRPRLALQSTKERKSLVISNNTVDMIYVRHQQPPNILSQSLILPPSPALCIYLSTTWIRLIVAHLITLLSTIFYSSWYVLVQYKQYFVRYSLQRLLKTRKKIHNILSPFLETHHKFLFTLVNLSVSFCGQGANLLYDEHLQQTVQPFKTLNPFAQRNRFTKLKCILD